MTIRELMEAYPGIPNAIAYVEGCLCGGDGVRKADGRTLWESWSDVRDPAEMAARARGLVAQTPPGALSREDKAAVRQMVAEMETTEFRTYIAGKMGAM